MKNIILILFILFQTSVSAQTYFFNKLFKPDTMNIGSPACLTVEDGYLVASTYNTLNDLKGFGVQKLDFEGNTKWFQHLDLGPETHAMVGGGILSKTLDNKYILVGSKDTIGIDGNLDIVMIKFDSDGNVIWKKTQGTDETVEGIYHISPTQDGGYILCGIQRSFTSNNHFYILKTDALGNKIWDKVLHEDKKGVAFTIEEAYDSGYITSGYVRYPDTKADMYVAKLSENGVLEWEKNYFVTPETDMAAKITKWKDNKYLLTGGVQENNNIKMYNAQLDILGNEEWEQIHSLQDGNFLQARPVILADGFVSSAYWFSSSGEYNVKLMRFDNLGNLVWHNSIPDTNPDEDWYLKDIALAVDGGYILSGFNYSTQSSWVVKTDSLGHTCSTMGCDSLAFATSVQELVLNNSSFKISPNPAQDVVQLSWQNKSLFNSKNYEIRLFDAFGILVKKEKINNTNASFNISDLENGIYFCQLFKEKELLGTEKMMVLH